MTTYNTGNPVPSADARDRYDNSQTLDEVVNGDSESYSSRTGKQVISLGGMNSRFNNAQDARESAFNLSQEENQEAFQSFLDGTGWSSLGAYGAGVSITSHTQTVDYQGQPYQLKPSIPASLQTPYVTTGVWATEGDNFKLVGDNSLRQDLSDPSTGTSLITIPLAYPGAEPVTLEQYLGTVVNARAFGVLPLPGYNNRKPLQNAINYANSLGVPVYAPGNIDEYLILGTVWLPSGTYIRGDGGLTKKTKFKAMDGNYSDLFHSGEHEEGAANTIDGITYRNGLPYSANNIGKNIGWEGIYINGNGDNAGYPPEIGPTTQYRGSGLRIRHVDGVFVQNAFAQYSPNDCIHISRCRRVWAKDCVGADNKLVGYTGVRADSTRNLFTFAGTMAWRPEFGDLSDFFVFDNIQGFNSEDIGINIQFIQEPGSPAISGPIIMRGLSTKNCAAYGTAIEVAGSGVNQNQRDCILIDQITSIGDSWLLPLASVLISQRSINVNIGSVIIKNACHRGLLCAGSKVLNISQIIVDGWGSKPRSSGIYVPAVHIYAAAGEPLGDRVNIAQVDIRNPGVGDCTGLEVSGFDTCKVDSVHVEETRFSSKTDGAGVLLACNHIFGDKITTNKTAGVGIRLSAFKTFVVNGSEGNNSGQTITDQAVGISVGAGSNRRGRLIGCAGNDTQDIPTQKIGILLGASATDVILVTACDGVGNITGPLKNLGMPNAKVHANLFDYVEQTSEFIIGGSGGFQSAIKMGAYYLWVDPSTSKWRTKASKPTSNSDGSLVGA